jgi:hypothetical protein
MCIIIMTQSLMSTKSIIFYDNYMLCLIIMTPSHTSTLLEVTLRSWHQSRRMDVGSSEAGDTASRDPMHKTRRCEVGGLTL